MRTTEKVFLVAGIPGKARGALLALLAMTGIGCASAQQTAPATAPPPASAAPAAPQAPAQAQEQGPPGVVPGVSNPDYIIGPGDTIQVYVWRNPELTVTLPVRPDGKISAPLVEDLVAVGKTPAQLARDVEQRLAEYVRNPQVNIIVSGAASAFSQVKVVGQVKSPQSLPFREGMTVLDVVLASGGLTEFAAGNRAKLVRKDETGKEVQIKLRLEDLVRKGRLADNVSLRPGDLILVPESWF